jgi:hypothetical protein
MKRRASARGGAGLGVNVATHPTAETPVLQFRSVVLGPYRRSLGADEIHAKVELIVLEREFAIRASRWTIADSARLVE